jgi:hypothetical protein
MTLVKLTAAQKKHSPRHSMRYKVGKMTQYVEMYGDGPFETNKTVQVVATKGLRDVSVR